MEREFIELPCYISGERYTALLDLIESEDADEVRIVMKSPMQIESVGETFFEALCKMRENLETSNIRLYCYGAALNCYPSPFILNTGSGRKAYKLTTGKQALSADIVDIFQNEAGLEIATVDEQQKWYADWLQSLRP